MKKDKILHMRIQKELKNKLKKTGKTMGLNLTDAVTMAINEFLFRYEKEGK